MKTTSRFALAAAAGLFVGAMAFTPAKAADLGGDCCADLEERVAELEATTVRKGNRVVSVEIYGQVNKALVIWDDGIDSDLYVTDNDVSSSRFGIRGSASMKPGWTAGYRFEFEVDSAASETVGQDDLTALDLGSNGDDGSRSSDINVRRTSLYIESDRFGRVQMGKTSSATDDINLINLGGTSGSAQDNDWNQGFLIRNSNGGDVPNQYYAENDGGDVVGGVFWGDVAPGLDLGRIDGVRYDTPSIYGFILSAAWGEDDFADVALRFSREWNSIRIAAGIGYFYDGDANNGEDVESLRGSISLMHTPTGIYATFAGVQQEFDDSLNAFAADDDDELISGSGALRDSADPERYYLQLGVARNWTGYGNTVVYGEYGHWEDFGVGSVVADLGTGGDADDLLIGSEVEHYGFGLEQNFDSAALTLYSSFKWFEADLDGVDTDGGDIDFDDGFENEDSEDWYAVMFGARQRF